MNSFAKIKNWCALNLYTTPDLTTPEDYMVDINLFEDESAKKLAFRMMVLEYFKNHKPKIYAFLVGIAIKWGGTALLEHALEMDFLPATVAGVSIGVVIGFRLHSCFAGIFAANQPTNTLNTNHQSAPPISTEDQAQIQIVIASP